MSEIEELSDEQRISLLESKVGKNRTVITVVAITLVVILSVSFTVLILKLLRVDEPYVSRTIFNEQKMITQALRTDFDKQVSKIEALSLVYQQSQVAAFQQIMIEQEQSYQEFLSTLKLGMFDMAKMVQGSRTWLEVYNEKLDDAKELSKLREKTLQRLK